MARKFEDIAKVFEAIAVAEKQHEKRYRDLAANIEAGRVFERESKVVLIYPDYPWPRPILQGLIATSLLPRSTMTMCSRQGRTRAGLLILSEKRKLNRVNVG